MYNKTKGAETAAGRQGASRVRRGRTVAAAAGARLTRPGHGSLICTKSAANRLQISPPLAATSSASSAAASSLPKRLPAPLILMKTDRPADAMMMMPRLR